MSKRGKVSPGGALKGYILLPLICMVVIVVADGALLLTESRLAKNLILIGLLMYIIVTAVYYFVKRQKINADLIRCAENFDLIQKQLSREMVLPYAMLDLNGRMLWGNNAFVEIIQNKKAARKSISNVLPGVTEEIFPKNVEDTQTRIQIEDRYYKVVMRLVSPDGVIGAGESDDGTEPISEDCVIGLYLYDETEMTMCLQKMEEEHIVMGLLYIDNYDEAMESINSVKRSLLVGLVDRKINKYMREIDAIIKKTEKDRYFFVFRRKYLEQLKEAKFDLLEEVRSVNIGNEMSMTISMGIGINDEGYQRTYDFTRAALDLALGRGGDQVVLKENDRITYYGGKSVQVEKSTRVKARVKAHALRELIEGKDQVIIMGHSITDADCIGSAIGVYRIAKTLNKRASIVVEKTDESVAEMLERFHASADYDEDFVVNCERAKQLVDMKTLLVIVDVNRPNYTDCPELLEQTKTIVVLDHHRQTGEKIENAVLSYIEPYASSACEMVAEILQYVDDGIKLKPLEAEALYSGIVIDTVNFTTKSGVRTFEAAAYLRKNGADITRIRKTFRSNLDDYRAKAEAISRAEVYKDVFMFAECEPGDSKNPTVLGAQVANELLNIAGIKATFVLTEYNGKVFISARSMDEVNVQIVMERLGGGGHLSVAGAQMADHTPQEAKQVLMELLDTMMEEGDL